MYYTIYTKVGFKKCAGGGKHRKGVFVRISSVQNVPYAQRVNSIYGKIASGKKIQKASDDAAGLAIANLLKRNSKYSGWNWRCQYSGRGAWNNAGFSAANTRT